MPPAVDGNANTKGGYLYTNNNYCVLDSQSLMRFSWRTIAFMSGMGEGMVQHRLIRELSACLACTENARRM